MNILSVFLIAASLSMDNFAVTLAAGATRISFPGKTVWRVSFLFAAAHFMMFSGGWLLGSGVGRWIYTFNYWIASSVFIFIGIRMIQETFSTQPPEKFRSLHTFHTRFLLAIATSLDAWLMGLGLSFTQISFWTTVLTLSGCVLITSYGGFRIGAWLGRQIGKTAEATGGIILILMGVKWLLQGLGIC